MPTSTPCYFLLWNPASGVLRVALHATVCLASATQTFLGLPFGIFKHSYTIVSCCEHCSYTRHLNYHYIWPELVSGLVRFAGFGCTPRIWHLIVKTCHHQCMSNLYCVWSVQGSH